MTIGPAEQEPAAFINSAFVMMLVRFACGVMDNPFFLVNNGSIFSLSLSLLRIQLREMDACLVSFEKECKITLHLSVPTSLFVPCSKPSQAVVSARVRSRY